MLPLGRSARFSAKPVKVASWSVKMGVLELQLASVKIVVRMRGIMFVEVDVLNGLLARAKRVARRWILMGRNVTGHWIDLNVMHPLHMVCCRGGLSASAKCRTRATRSGFLSRLGRIVPLVRIPAWGRRLTDLSGHAVLEAEGIRNGTVGHIETLVCK